MTIKYLSQFYKLGLNMRRKKILITIITVLIITSFAILFSEKFKSSYNDKPFVTLKLENKEYKIYTTYSPYYQGNQRKLKTIIPKLLLSFGTEKKDSLFFPIKIKMEAKGYIAILDQGDKSIKFFNSNKKLVKKIGGYGKGPGEFILPMNFYFDNSNNLYVVDINLRRVTIFKMKDTTSITLNKDIPIEICPINTQEIALLKSSINNENKPIEIRNIKDNIIRGYAPILNIEDNLPVFYDISAITVGNILYNNNLIYIPNYLNHIIFFNQNGGIKNSVCTIDLNKFPIINNRAKYINNNRMIMGSFNELKKYKTNLNSYIIDGDIFILSKDGTEKYNAIVFDRYEGKTGEYIDSWVIKGISKFADICLTENKLLIIDNKLAIKEYTYVKPI